MQHLWTISREDLGRNGKTLLQRAAGRFYTPAWMAEALADRLLALTALSRQIRVIDPFSGDARLLLALIRKIQDREDLRNKHWHFEVWDNDAEPLKAGERDIIAAVEKGGLTASVARQHCDTFETADCHAGTFDLVLTNPPWEVLKPDSREMAGLTTVDRQRAEQQMREYDRKLASLYPHSQPASKMYGWGTNLSRCGLEASARLLRAGGSCGIVLPASLLADQVSAPLRRWLVSSLSVHSIDYFNAEAKPFAKVDIPAMFAVIEKKTQAEPLRIAVRKYGRDRQCGKVSSLTFSRGDLEKLNHRLPIELDKEELDLLLKLSRHGKVSDWETSRGGTLWMGREIDETGCKTWVSEQGEVGFAKGRDITRFGKVGPLSRFIKPECVEVPKSAGYMRVAWRDISRRSQVRRMLATLMPAGVVTGNSLHVAYFLDADPVRLRALLGILNSLTFEFQVRARLGTGHMSLGAVRQAHIPDLGDRTLLRKISCEVEDALGGSVRAEARIEALVAEGMELNQHERRGLLSHFPGLSQNMRDSMKEALSL